MSGVLVGEGRFRVDRKLALEKMEKFQLEDPYRYVLELVAAAVCAGADRITITNDSDDFVIGWTGLMPLRTELDGLFDALFGHPDDPRAHVLQHLAVGTLGALGLEPRWLRIDRGPLDDEPAIRLEVRDPAETVTVQRDEDLDGMRIAIRERLGVATVTEALELVFRPPLEARLIQGAARWCPVPIRINGRPMPKADPPGAFADAPTDRGHLWLVGPGGVVDVVRHGIVVGHLPGVVLGPCSIAGWIRYDTLRLNASRSAVVEDDRWWAFRSRLDTEIHMFVRGLSADEVRRIAVPALELLGGSPLGALGGLPVLVDAFGRAWSADALRALVPPPGTSTGPFDPDDPRPVFVGDAARIVTAVCPAAVDRTDELGRRLAGRKRRAEASRIRREPFFAGNTAQRRFDRGTITGAVRLDPSMAPGPIDLSVRIAGVAVRTVTLPSIGPAIEAIVDNPAFQAEPEFLDLVRDETWDTATALVAAEAKAHVLDIAERDVDQQRLGVLTACLRAPDNGALRARVAAIDPVLRDLRAVLTGTGQRLSAAAVASADTAWIVLERLPPEARPEQASRVLLLPSAVSRHWARWLGDPDPQEFLDDVSRAARLAGPRFPARFERPPPIVVDVAVDGITGVLGREPSAASPRVTVFRDGVPVRDLVLLVGVPGLCGLIDVPDLDVDRAHADLRSPAVLTALEKRLAPAIEALVLAVWDDSAFPVRPLPAWIPVWLTTNRSWSAAIRGRPIAVWSDGRIATLADLARLAVGKKGAKIAVVTRRPSADLGFEDLLVADDAVRALLSAWVPNQIRDATRDVAAAVKAAATFHSRRYADPIPAFAERTVAFVDGVEVRYVIPLDPERVGQFRLEARWDGRVLVTRAEDGFGPTVVIEGPLVLPDRTFTNLRDPALFAEITKGARAVAVAVLHDVLGRPLRREDTPLWLAIRRQLEAGDLRAAIDAAVVLECLDGEWRSVAELSRAAGVVRVGVEIALGGSPFPLTVRDRPGVAAALVGSRDETATIVKWRVAQLIRQGARKRAAILAGPVLRRAPFQDGKVTGELGIVAVGGPDGLVIEPLVDGVAVPTITVPFPAPVRVILDGVTADPTFERATLSAGTRERLRDAAHALGRAAVESLGDEPELVAWAQLYLLGDGVRGTTAVFPVLGGGFVTRAELDQRAQTTGGVAVVARDSRPLPGGPQPVVASSQLRSALAARFKVVDLDAVVARAMPPPRIRPEVPVPIPAPRRGEVGYVPGVDGVEVRLGHLALGTLAPAWPLPLGGWIEDPAIVPTVGWDGITDGPATTALRAELVRLSRAAIALRADRRGPPNVLVSALRRLATTPDAVRALVRGTSSDPLAARLAGEPLFEDGNGRMGTVQEVVADRPIRAVSLGTTADPAPGRSRFWRLDDETRAWLGLAERVVDAEDAARIETTGNERRARDPWRGPPTPPTAEFLLGGILWLGALTDTVAVLVGGRKVMDLPVRVQGVTGRIEGDWPTDDGFVRVEVPSDVIEEVERVVTVLLTREARSDPRGFARRLAASAGPTRVPAVLRAVPLPGGTVGELVDELARYKHLVYSEVGDPPSESDRRVVPDETRQLLGLAWPTTKFVRAAAVPTKPTRTEERQAVAVTREGRRTRDAVSALAEGWAGSELRAAVRATVEGWADAPPAWLPRVDSDPEIAVAAWAAVAAVSRSPETELRALERLADALAQRTNDE